MPQGLAQRPSDIDEFLQVPTLLQVRVLLVNLLDLVGCFSGEGETPHVNEHSHTHRINELELVFILGGWALAVV